MGRFLKDSLRCAFRGGNLYYGWLGFLGLCIGLGLYPIYLLLTKGLIVTGASDQVTLTQLLANFIFTAHVAAAAILVVIPGFVYKREDMKDLTVLGEIVAIGFVTSGLIFVLLHMGRPERFWHMLPFVGYPNFPNSTLVFDAITLNTYWLLNVVAVAIFLYRRYRGLPVHSPVYRFVVWWAILWGPLIHIITAAVLGNNARMFAWNTAVLPFAFLSMAGASGPAIVILCFLVIRKYTALRIPDSAIDVLAKMVAWSMGIVVAVYVFEHFAVLYNSTEHADWLKFAMMGHHGLNDYVPWYWFIVVTFLGSFFALLFRRVRQSYNRWLPLVCFIVAASILLEKPYFMVFPAFSPSPLGEYVVYHTTAIEFLAVVATWAIGMLLMTLLLRVGVGVLTGEVALRPGKTSTEQSPEAMEKAPFAPEGGVS